MKVSLSNPGVPGPLGNYLSKLNQDLIRAFLGVPSETQAVKQIILQSSNGTKYAVTVDDAGTLTTTAVS